MPEVRLPLYLSSVGAARRWTESQLGNWSDDGRTGATLVVSELVANVVLHARTECRLALDRQEDCCRITVADGDPRVPTPRRYSDDAPTGRGLRLVARLASEWGVQRRPDGKAVWAVLHDRPWSLEGWGSSGPAGPSEVTGSGPDEVWDGQIEVRLVGVPLHALMEAQEHNDELIREFAFLAASRHMSARLDALARQVEDHFGPAADGLRSEVEQAEAGGQASVDLNVRLSRDGWAALQSLSALLDEADSYCERAELLTLASSPAVRKLRSWYNSEVRRQMEGRPPTPWEDASWPVRRPGAPRRGS